MNRATLYELLNVDLDRHLNPWIPHNRLYILPRPLHHFLGYRREPSKEPPSIVQWVLTFIATLAGLCAVAGAFVYAPGIAKFHPPAVIASMGASAVLDFNAVRSPLAQPRNAIFGHTLAAIVGVAIAKLFQLQPELFAEYAWVAGAVGCACASLVMSATNTVHPPGGATAVLASTDAALVGLGWMFVPLVLVGSLIMMGVALLFNNTLRQYPIFWWTPQDVGRKLRSARSAAADAQADTKVEAGHDARLQKKMSITDSECTLRRELSNHVDFVEGTDDVRIMSYKVQLPPHIELTQDEIALLENIQERLRTHAEVGG